MGMLVWPRLPSATARHGVTRVLRAPIAIAAVMGAVVHDEGVIANIGARHVVDCVVYVVNWLSAQVKVDYASAIILRLIGYGGYHASGRQGLDRAAKAAKEGGAKQQY